MNYSYGNMENITSNNRVWINYTVARLNWVVIENIVIKIIPALSV